MSQIHGALYEWSPPVKHIPVQAVVAAKVNGTAISMKGWDGVEFSVPYGVFGTNGTLDIGPVQVDDNSGFNSPTNIANSSLTQIPAANANGLAIIDVGRSAFPSGEVYVRLQVTGQTNGVTAGVNARRYRGNGVTLPPATEAQFVLKITG